MNFLFTKFDNVFSFLDPPSPPENLNAENVTKTSATLVWDRPESDGGSPITGYILEKLTFSRWTKVTKKPTPDLYFSVSDLVENEEYEFRVMAVNDAGTSKASETVRFVAKLPYDVPSKPGKPVVEELTAESATLSWAAPDKDGGSPITNYLVEMKLKRDRNWKPLTADKNMTKTTFTVTGLKEETDYDFRVTAENNAGLGTASDSASAKYVEAIVFVRDLQDIKLTSIPKEVTFECELSKTNLSVEWYKGDKLLRRGEKYDIKVTGKVHSLIIRDASGEDMSEYTARVTKDVTSTAKLIVEGMNIFT